MPGWVYWGKDSENVRNHSSVSQLMPLVKVAMRVVLCLGFVFTFVLRRNRRFNALPGC